MSDGRLTSDPGFGKPGVTAMETVRTEPAQYIPCSSKTITASCTFCGKPLVENHVCLVDPPQPIQPNRFDPYEALDKSEGGIEDIRNFYPDLDPRCEEISERLNALRAYITGMEK